MNWIQWFEALSYVVTVVGLPLAIYVFLQDKRKERRAEADTLNQRLNDAYTSFLTLVLDNADLKLFQAQGDQGDLTGEQKERKKVLFAMLISVFEQAYIALYEKEMGRHAYRRWLSWEDDMCKWCRRSDFRTELPGLLEGEDDDFSLHILGIAKQEADYKGPSAQPRP
ncbi:hypothetical protein [Microbulbifer spongiae]|uniref:DUF4760 domain-containing protein n=1 Tax=Microbulbifer spongiae TaxID=2944933 RepID=A0ABY9E8V3_9GAMM|nr:hypothetical protein [Microbulbifer sp. MI-G]WKD48376.1 hypothetical protein M8T91_10560 [Microbulbifer sp. MI-G]